MTEALRARLLALPTLPAPEIVEDHVDAFAKAQTEYREARDKVDLYDEALKARPYIAQLEQKLAEAESLLRARSRRGRW
jgi:hypothetical protein